MPTPLPTTHKYWPKYWRQTRANAVADNVTLAAGEIHEVMEPNGSRSIYVHDGVTPFLGLSAVSEGSAFPSYARMEQRFGEIIAGGSMALLSSSAIYGYYQASGAGTFRHLFGVRAGTYKLRCTGQVDATPNENRGYLQISIDGVYVGQQNFGDPPGGDPKIMETTGIVIATDGVHTLDGTSITGPDGYAYIVLRDLEMIRTGP